MLLWALVLVPVVLAGLQEKTINNYIVKIDKNTLKSVEPTSTLSRVLNLSGLGLRVLEKNSLDTLTFVTNLDLGNNSISSIPHGLLSKLENLEHLSLADNDITYFKKPFEGLSRLKTLNISNNPVTGLWSTDLYGLTKSSVVFTKGLSLSSLSVYVFEKERGPFFADVSSIYEQDFHDETTTITSNQNPTNKTPEQEVNTNKIEITNKQDDSEKPELRRKRMIATPDDYVMKNYYIKICIRDSVLELVEIFKDNETLPSGCRKSEMYEHTDLLRLEIMRIAKFKKGWYQLDKLIHTIRLSRNNIVEVTSELLNDLPASVSIVDLSGNKIRRLKSRILNNSYVRELTLSSNEISEIEADALVNMPKLGDLFLDKNRLSDTKFAASLPNSLFQIHLERNRITEISPGSFSRLSRLVYLCLNGNLIQAVRSDSLHGLVGLVNINLSNNRIFNIEPTAFQHTDLRVVNLANNSIASFGKGTFDNLHISKLDVSYNKLASINETFPDADNLDLNLDFNGIKELDRDTFKNVPVHYLSLVGNKISKIKRDTFNARTLRTIILDKNSLNELDNDSFHSLKRIQRLSFRENRITSIPKGFTRNMRHLWQLDLSKNPIKRLQNGALYGFRRSGFNTVLLDGVPVEVIEGGLFDDV